MKLYSMCTPSHIPLKDKAFLPSIKDEFEILIKEFSQECSTGDYKSPGWVKTITRKVDVISQAIEDNWGGVFIWADIDIQFFKPMRQKLLQELSENDFVIARDSPDGMLCTGFFVTRANKKTRFFWKCVGDILDQANNQRDEQDVANALLRNGWTRGRMAALRLYLKHLGGRVFTRNAFNVLRRCCKIVCTRSWDLKWRYLPEEYFGGGTLTGRQWIPGAELPVPKGIILHHANWTVGISNKLAQMEYVRSRLTDRIKNDCGTRKPL